MILIDTHIWMRWLLPNDPLPPNLIDLIETANSLTVSSFHVGRLFCRNFGGELNGNDIVLLLIIFTLFFISWIVSIGWKKLSCPLTLTC